MAITKVTSGLISADASSVDLNIDAGTLYIDATNNRVGIGTTSPTTALDVTGTATMDGLTVDGATTLTHSGTTLSVDRTGGATALIELKQAGTIRGYLGADSTKSLIVFNNSAAEKFSVSNTGIDVTGTATMDGLTVNSGAANTTVYFSNSGTPYATWYNDTNGVSILSADAGNTGIATRLQFNVGGVQALRLTEGGDIAFYEDTGTTPKLYWDASTERLGIGTTSPSALLTVAQSTIGQYALLYGDNVAGGRGLAFASSTTTNVGDTHTINAQSTTGVLKLATQGLPRLTINNVGNVGIGTTSPTGVGNYKVLQIRGNATTNGGMIRLETSNGTSGVARFYAGSGSTVLESNSNTPLTFGTNATERMRIDTSGRLLVGTTSSPTGAGVRVVDGGAVGDSRSSVYFGLNGVYPSANLTLADNSRDLGTASWRWKDLYLSGGVSLGGNINATGVTTSVYAWKSTSNSTSASKHLIFANPNGNVGDIRTNISSTSYVTSSDYRLKENVVTDWDATTRLKQLKPSRFNFIVDADTTVDGFLAHEVQDIVPEAITGVKDAVDADGNPEYQGIDQSKLVPLLTKAIQEQQALIEAQATTITDLTTRIEILENA